MTQLSIKNLVISFMYVIIAILQTLNIRFLYRNLHFNFYSFVFAIQKFAIILIFYLCFKSKIRKETLIRVIPYSLLVGLSNILASYCITIMPLAAYLSLKKFIVLFILVIAITFKLPCKTTKFQNISMVGILIGGSMVGEQDLFNGNFMSYFCILTYDLTQSIISHYSVHLYNHHQVQPQQLLLYNCIIGLPYYLFLFTFQFEFLELYFFLKDNCSFTLIVVLIFSIVLSCISQISSVYITMKISPFDKSIVSNIKDLILMLISVQYFRDLHLTPISGFGLCLCLCSSVIFTIPFKNKNKISYKDKSQFKKIEIKVNKICLMVPHKNSLN